MPARHAAKVRLGLLREYFEVARDHYQGFVTEQKVIVRSVYNATGIRIANVQHLEPGERILWFTAGTVNRFVRFSVA